LAALGVGCGAEAQPAADVGSRQEDGVNEIFPVVAGAAVGAGVRGHAVGTRVLINPMLNWGSNPRIWSDAASILGMPREGTFAQFISVPAER